MAHFDLPLDLPHAGRIADRILALVERHIEEHSLGAPQLLDIAEQLSDRLFRYSDTGENPTGPEAMDVRDDAAMLGRQLVRELERSSIAGDRLGQFVRNFFECLELGAEGAEISLRAGENPHSLQRPV